MTKIKTIYGSRKFQFQQIIKRILKVISVFTIDLDEINEYEMERSPSPHENILNGVPVNGYQEPVSFRNSYDTGDCVKLNIRGKVRGKQQ